MSFCYYENLTSVTTGMWLTCSSFWFLRRKCSVTTPFNPNIYKCVVEKRELTAHCGPIMKAQYLLSSDCVTKIFCILFSTLSFRRGSPGSNAPREEVVMFVLLQIYCPEIPMSKQVLVNIPSSGDLKDDRGSFRMCSCICVAVAWEPQG